MPEAREFLCEGDQRCRRVSEVSAATYLFKILGGCESRCGTKVSH